MTDKQPIPMWPDTDDGGVFGYMCLSDFEYELGAASGGNTIYPDIEDVKKHRRCVPVCGIVKVKVTGVEIIEKSNYGEDK